MPGEVAPKTVLLDTRCVLSDQQEESRVDLDDQDLFVIDLGIAPFERRDSKPTNLDVSVRAVMSPGSQTQDLALKALKEFRNNSN